MCPLQLWTYIWSLELYDASSANIALWLHARVSPRPASNYSYGDPLISIIKASKRNINMLRCWIMLREGLKKVKIWWNFPSSGWPSPPPPMMENSVKSQSGGPPLMWRKNFNAFLHLEPIQKKVIRWRNGHDPPLDGNFHHVLTFFLNPSLSPKPQNTRL